MAVRGTMRRSIPNLPAVPPEVAHLCSLQPALMCDFTAWPVTQISCGCCHTLLLGAGGDVYVWGSVPGAQCYLESPTRVQELDTEHVVQVHAAHGDSSAVLTCEGRVYTWGDPSAWQSAMLGHGEHKPRSPMLVESLLPYQVLRRSSKQNPQAELLEGDEHIYGRSNSCHVLHHLVRRHSTHHPHPLSQRVCVVFR